MNKRNTRRLMLNKETLRNLQDRELSLVVGGVNAQGVNGNPWAPGPVNTETQSAECIVLSNACSGASCSCPPPGGIPPALPQG